MSMAEFDKVLMGHKVEYSFGLGFVTALGAGDGVSLSIGPDSIWFMINRVGL